jgi:predicted KAP-like P-loop ATPase
VATSGEHPFSADRPISSASEDLLGRAAFAQSLARAIGGWRQRDSLVIGLYGPWGEGKTSVKNMALESLRKSHTGVSIVEFNPWQWSGQEQLASAFFDQIGLALGRRDKSVEGRRRAAKWRAYAGYIRAGSLLLGGVPRFLFPVLVLLGSVGLVLQGLGFFAPLLRLGFAIAGAALLFLAALLSQGGKFAEHVSAAISAQVEASQKSLEELRKELAELLAKLQAPLVVVVDDVDRLEQQEVRLLFQLVKANADFPSMVYLMLFQRETIEQSLEETAGGSGREFLEKIIQVGFDVPTAERSRLEESLLDGLDRILIDTAVQKLFNKRRWANVFVPGISGYFQTLRDVRRFLAMLAFHLSLFVKDGTPEVNPVDLIALEALRVFEPEVYREIPPLKVMVTRLAGRGLYGKEGDAETRRILEALADRAAEPNRNRVREIIKQLFPAIGWVFGGVQYPADRAEQWLREVRVCHPDTFDRYFHLVIPHGDISQVDIERALALAGDRKELIAHLRSLGARNLLGVALERLEAYKQQIDLKDAVPFITALFDMGEELPKATGGMFEIEPDMHVLRIVLWYLRRVDDQKQREKILEDAITATTGLYLPIRQVYLEGSADDPDSRLLDDAQLPQLRQLCLTKIRNAAQQGVLETHSKMGYLLYRWSDWAGPGEPRQWVSDLLGTDNGLLRFLEAFLQPVGLQGIGDYTSQRFWHVSLKNLEKFASIDVISKRVDSIEVDKLSDEGRQAVTAFTAAIKRQREGLQDDDLKYDEGG